MLVFNLIRLAFHLVVFAVSCVIGLIRMAFRGVVALFELFAGAEDDDSQNPNLRGGRKCPAR